MRVARRAAGRSYRADIVIPVHNAHEHFRRCWNALQGLPDFPMYHVIVVDDASDPPVADIVHDAPNVTYIRQEKQQGFPRTVNRGVSHGNSPHLVLLNSDVVVNDGTIPTLLRYFEDQEVGVVAPKLLFPPGSADPNRPGDRVQHAGIVFKPNGFPYHAFLGWSADHPKVNRTMELQAVTGALMVTRRDLFEHVGGFSPDYGLGTFEDVEYCVVVRYLGHKVLYTPKSTAYHYVGASGGKFDVTRNYHIFMARVGEFVVWDEWLVL